LLLAIAVILPTVCLLWFMSQAVKNERLAVRQKLIEVYMEKAKPFIENLHQSSLKFEQEIQQTAQDDLFSFFIKFCCDKEYAEGILVYDSNGQLLFPVTSDETFVIDSEKFTKAWKAEFNDSNYTQAISEYEQIAEANSISYEIFQCNLAVIRCLEKTGNIEKAISNCKQLAYTSDHSTFKNNFLARLKLIELYRKYDSTLFENEVRQLLSDILSSSEPTAIDIRAFVLNELLGIIDKAKLPGEKINISKAQKFLQAYTLSFQIVQHLSAKENLHKWQEKKLITFNLPEKIFGMLFKNKSRNIILCGRSSTVIEVLKYVAEKISDSAVIVGVFDEQENEIYGIDKNPGDAFMSIKPNEYLGQKWKLLFFFHNSGVFDNAANKQETIYIWTGLLVAGLVLSSGLLAAQAISRQAKLNKLKNDFIATITHELKTPLSSMRVLVDTLLEGKCENREQETEYLQLIAKENGRLSRLIDNFLTFSRMERNKQVFEFALASPVEIANNAAEAIQAKFEKANVYFNMNIANPLPTINADKDALTTVLVNLLDNAYKYSNESKQIELNVFIQDSNVCFEVKDNGLGMTRWQMKRIFDRFYQADTSLSRQTEGAGLGLSIVKFIVDAHKGKIEVESKIGKGSAFTVRLTANEHE